MTSHFAIFLILTGVLGCQASPLNTSSVDNRCLRFPKPFLKPCLDLVRPKPSLPAMPRPVAPEVVAMPEAESPADHLAEASRCLERDDLKNAGAHLAST